MDDVEDKLMRRKTRDMIIKLDTMLGDMTQRANTIIDQSINNIYQVISKKTDESIYTAPQQVSSAMALIHERMTTPGGIIGYDLGPGFSKLTRALLGLQTKALTIIAANQGVGKTMLGENWAMYIACVSMIPTLWFSFEMDKDRMTFRNLSILSGIPLTDILTGNISVEDKIKILDPCAIRLNNAPFYMSEIGNDLVEALAIARRHVVKYGVKVIFVDYIQLQYVSDLRNPQRHRELGIISKAWKQFSKDYDVAVVAISQLSKEALDSAIAKAEHGSGSYEIAQDADNYFTMKERSEDEIKQRGIENGNLIGNLDKNRMGQDDILIDLYQDKSVQRINEVG
jgi:replicative DNA helicase